MGTDKRHKGSCRAPSKVAMGLIEFKFRCWFLMSCRSCNFTEAAANIIVSSKQSWAVLVPMRDSSRLGSIFAIVGVCGTWFCNEQIFGVALHDESFLVFGACKAVYVLARNIRIIECLYGSFSCKRCLVGTCIRHQSFKRLECWSLQAGGRDQNKTKSYSLC